VGGTPWPKRVRRVRCPWSTRVCGPPVGGSLEGPAAFWRPPLGASPGADGADGDAAGGAPPGQEAPRWWRPGAARRVSALRHAVRSRCPGDRRPVTGRPPRGGRAGACPVRSPGGCASVRPRRQPGHVGGMRHSRPLDGCPSLPTAAARASGSASAWTVAGGAPGGGRAGAQRPKDARGWRRPGRSHGGWCSPGSTRTGSLLVCVSPFMTSSSGDAEALWALLSGSGRLLGAASADVVACLAAGAAGMWHRVARLRPMAERPAAKLVAGLDCDHASQELSAPRAPCRHRPHAPRCTSGSGRCSGPKRRGEKASWRRGTRGRRHSGARPSRGPGAAVEAHAHRTRSVALEARQRSIGSGQVERAVWRVSHLRCKAPGALWTATTGRGLRHLRAACKAGRWDESRRGGSTATSHVPSFDPVDHAVPQPSAALPGETPQAFVTPQKKAA
jgi:hypothetical protein